MSTPLLYYMSYYWMLVEVEFILITTYTRRLKGCNTFFLMDFRMQSAHRAIDTYGSVSKNQSLGKAAFRKL